MKERIVIPKDKIKVLTSGSRFPANGYFTFYKEDVEVEQVPENWGDFLELCKTLKKVFISSNEYYVEFNRLRFYMDGTVEFNGVIIKIVVGVSRMWQIIKSLILGEE